jgi:hypothetical protein
MSTPFRALTTGAAAVAALGLSFAVHAQAADDDARSHVAPQKGDTFVGLNIGKASYGTSCGVAGLTCQNNVTSYSVSAGNMFTRDFGAELALLNFGTAHRADGGVTARGINLSAVARLPLGDYFGLDAKVGTTYGVTHVSALDNAGVPTGRAKGFGLAYGGAFDIDITHGLRGQIGWEQHDFHFAGQGTSNVRNVTVGLACSF